MALRPAVDVPLNTTIADLDDTLRALLTRDLEKHGFEGVEIAFDAPDAEWSSALSRPTVNAFLYDLCESAQDRPTEWTAEQAGGGVREQRPPLLLEVSFAVTAWARAVEDEHRLLSQVLAILYAYPTLPRDLLSGSLGELAVQNRDLKARVGRSRSEGRSDFWSALGGRYKASLDYLVTLTCDPGFTLTRGPEVRTQTLRVRDVDGRAGNVVELQRTAGRVLDPAGEPIADVWVAIPELGAWTSSGPDGRYTFDRVRPGTYRCVARAPDGGEHEADLVVPGAGSDIRFGAQAPRSRARRTR